ncbi:glyoxylase-like metal-dependent hydrolase (beta-lactamase superfamily II) [Salirhabdus euzebyi]|uniref:Glyoxylase-like metal-dependent hydrolase (Beta-lactamase superfamily II) n=1 Tax=Salirhabdus euzebyi TaxID=394506 RepID=A0A841Q3Q5_9BACI|nr:MBL fold metallo-hydrolase [Salirhabdus euzebyi]MBB6453015.1 glyoxylase-like metal-dependent hydrolase (beta-lactamase superfamily II) [Salirhabdus euzebyi]
MTKETFVYNHFTLEKVSDGVYAAIATDNGGAFSNSGIIDLGDQIIIFDTFFTPQAAIELREAAKRLSDNPITTVINSHWHSDHIRGNQVFEQFDILSTTKTKKIMMEELTKQMKQQQDSLNEFINHIQSLENSLKEETDVQRKISMQNQISGYNYIKETLPSLKLVLPNIVFKDYYKIEGKTKSVELISYGGAHTKSDLLMVIPEDNIIFSGDILVVENHPFTLDGNLKDWVSTIDKILNLSFEVIVPGHGRIGTREDIMTLRQYLTLLIEYRQTNDEKDKEKIKGVLTDNYNSWGKPEFFTLNIENKGKEN